MDILVLISNTTYVRTATLSTEMTLTLQLWTLHNSTGIFIHPQSIGLDVTPIQVVETKLKVHLYNFHNSLSKKMDLVGL